MLVRQVAETAVILVQMPDAADGILADLAVADGLSGLFDLDMRRAGSERETDHGVDNDGSAGQAPRPLPGIDSAAALARSKQLESKGDDLAWNAPRSASELSTTTTPTS